MKKIMLSLLGVALFAVSTFAQNFEGHITFKMEIKGENAALYSLMMPNSMDIFMLGQDALVRMNGGMVKTGDIITKGAESKSYMVMHKKKTIYTMDKEKSADVSKPTVENKGTETVKGYKCTKYLVKFAKEDGKEMYQYMWCTKDIKFNKPKSSGNTQLFLDEIEGFPVKIDQYITVSQQGQTMTINQEMTLDKIVEEKPDAKMFVIPSNYKVEAFDEKKLME